MCRKVTLCYLKRLVHALTDGNRGNHNDKFGEPATLVQFKNGFRVDVSLASSGLHFHAKPHLIHIISQGQIASLLHSMHVFAQRIFIDKQRVPNAEIILQQVHLSVLLHSECTLALILTGKQVDHSIDRISLKFLIFEF